MRLSTIGLMIAALAAVVAGTACGLILSVYAPGVGPLMLFFGITPVLKVIVIFIGLMLPGMVVVGLAGLAWPRRQEAGPGPAEVLLWLSASLCVAFGVLAGLYGEMNTQLGIKAVGPVSFAVTAPSRAESLLALTVGLSGAALALAFSVGIVTRRLGVRPEPAGPALDI